MNTSMTDAGTLEREIRAELARSPGNAGLHAALGGLRLSAGYVEDAVGYLEKAATLAPSNPAILGDCRRPLFRCRADFEVRAENGSGQ